MANSPVCFISSIPGFFCGKERASGSSGRRGSGPDGHDPLASSRLIRATLPAPLNRLLPKAHPILQQNDYAFCIVGLKPSWKKFLLQRNGALVKYLNGLWARRNETGYVLYSCPKPNSQNSFSPSVTRTEIVCAAPAISSPCLPSDHCRVWSHSRRSNPRRTSRRRA